MTRELAGQPWQDVRRIGFAGRVELDRARAALDELLPEPCMEAVPIGVAIGRVTARAGVAPVDLPASPVARADGYALTAATTYGASSYNPIAPAGRLQEVSAGETMPAGSDSVLGYGAAVGTDGVIEIVDPAAPGEGVMPAGGLWTKGDEVIPAGRRLDALDVARAAEAGLTEVVAWCRPRVALLIAGAKQDRSPVLDPLAALLGELVARDGGVVERERSTLQTVGDVALVLVAGRSGCGSDDDAAPTIAACGRMVWHGLAIAPGGSSGLGSSDGIPVALLPGEPLACLAAYELVAGPALRRLAGLDPALPHSRARHRLAAKIASRPGTVEFWLVGAEGAEVRPLAHPDLATLASTGEAIGFVVVPASSEGYPAGAEVEVHLLGGRHG